MSTTRVSTSAALPSSARTSPHRGLVRRVTGLVLGVSLGLALTAALGSRADAATVVSHDAIGSSRSITAVPGVGGSTATTGTAGLLALGWAGDPDAGTADTVVIAVLDGTSVIARTTTSVPMPKVTAAHDLGPTPGFALTVPVPTGNHTVCIVARDVGPGLGKVLQCVLTPLGRAITSSVTANRSPRGSIVTSTATTRSAVFSGWADDPDDLMRASEVTLYLDGSVAATENTLAYPSPRPTGAAYHSAFSFTVPVSSGAHLGCVWATNVGLGQNTFLGCDAVDTRAGQPVSGAAPAADAAKVVTEAKKHIGQAYVWGAAGPKSFDCSGLVTYAYGKYGYSVPHQSGMQFAQAYLIPAEDAVPGDLVFYHDSTGDVYHVGVYTGPGMTVAAIDTAEGVNYQSIYSSTWATYGSFTHTASVDPTP